MGAFARSWEITRLCFKVLKEDKEMLMFPVLSGLFSLLFIAAMVIPYVIPAIISGAGMKGVGQALFLLIAFVLYFGLAFIATFFNVCVVYTAKTRFSGGNATFLDSLKFAVSRMHLILMWSLVSASVGIILRILDNIAQKMGIIGRLIMGALNSLLGMMWSIITIFIVPAMVYDNLGPLAAIKKSVEVLKRTWGESLIRYVALGFVQGLFIVFGIIGCVIFFIFLSVSPMVTIAGLCIAVLYFVSVILLFSVLNSIFNTALFAYAETGTVPSGFDAEMLRTAFQTHKGVL